MTTATAIQAIVDTVDPVDFLVQAARKNFAAFVAATHKPRYKHSIFSAQVCREIDKFVDDVIAGKRPVLILTAPPQHGKSSLIARCLPPYLFGRLTGELPAVRIACASYAQAMANRNRRDAQSILSEPIYREIFPATSLIGFKGIDNSADGLELPQNGWLRGVGMGGPLTGFSVDCFARGTEIDTDQGPILIENLHLHAKTVKVLSHNNGILEYASVQAIGHRKTTRLFRITTKSGRVLEVTGNHPIYANGRYTPAAELTAGDILLRALPHPVNAHSSRLHEASASVGLGGALLQQAVCGCGAPASDEQVRGLRNIDELARCKTLSDVPPGAADSADSRSRASTCDCLSNMWKDVHEPLEGGCSANMQPCMRSDGAFGSDVGHAESALQGRCGEVRSAAGAAQQSDVSLCKAGDAGTGQAQVRTVRCDEAVARTSHRREPAAQFVLQFANALRDVSQTSAPAYGREYEDDTVQLVEIIDGAATVYDLQVEKNANLFANGILAHNCGIIDDAVKNSEEALSETIQERNRDWFDSVFMTRLQQRSGIVIIGTPWSANDLIAHAQKVFKGQDCLTLLSFPALNEPDEIGYDPDLPRGALVPHLHDEKKLRELKRNISSTWWAAMFQQRPLADLGAIFPRVNVQHYRRADLPKTFQRVIMSVDATFKDGKSSDYVAVGVWGKTAGERVWLIDKRREKLAFMATAQAIADLKHKHPSISRIFIEDAANGAALVDMLKKHFTGLEGVPPLGSKEARAHAVSWVWSNNCVMLPDPAEVPDIVQWVAEITSFPDVKNDDTVDCMTIALQQLCLRTPIASMITREILSRLN